MYKTLVYTFADLISGDLSIRWQTLDVGEIREEKPKLLAGKPYYSWAAFECVFPLDVWRPLRSKNAL